MARIRTIKPEFWQDEDLASVSEAALILAVGLLNHADDEGYFRAHPGLIKAAIFPLRDPSSTVPVLLQELSEIGYLMLLPGNDGKQYGLIKNFSKHQVINKFKPSKIKGLIELPEEYRTDTVELPGGKEQGKERNREQGKEQGTGNNTVLPDWLDPKIWHDFVENRKKIKAKMTDRAQELAIKKLENLMTEGHDPAAVLEQSIMNGWKGLFPIREQRGKGNGSHQGSSGKGFEYGDRVGEEWLQSNAKPERPIN